MTEPGGFLREIADSKRAELARRFDGVALDALRARAEPTRRSLRAALAHPGARFLFEIKKSSPSAGTIRADADVAAIARGYAGVADGLSVLIDGARFGGSLVDLAVARGQFDGPILAKDFFLDPRQVVEARLHGADAVLAMLSLLDDVAARAIIAEAERLGMDVLVEVHDEGEMARAFALGAPLIGINNRDFRDLSVNLRTTERLAPLAAGRTLVSESGIADRSDIDRLAGQVDAFLIGSSLMRAADPAQAARALAYGRVKLCGLNRRDDLVAGRAASFAGLMFVEASPRSLSLDAAAPLADEARRFGICPVGVFRDSPLAEVADHARVLGLGAVQLHGSEDEDYVASLGRALPDGCEIWVAVDGSSGALDRAGDRLLFDHRRGGTGETFDWSRIADHSRLPAALVAGGIGPANARAAQALGAYAIDVGSALDERPGRKSPARIAALFDALRPDCRKELAACA